MHTSRGDEALVLTALSFILTKQLKTLAYSFENRVLPFNKGKEIELTSHYVSKRLSRNA